MQNAVHPASLTALVFFATHALPVHALTRSSRTRRIAGGAIAGIAIGCIVAFILALVLLWFCCCRRRSRRAGGRFGQNQSAVPIAPVAGPGMAEAGYTGSAHAGPTAGHMGQTQSAPYTSAPLADNGTAYAPPTAPPAMHGGEKQHFVGGFKQPGTV